MSFVGRKIDGQLRFTGHEVYFFAIMRALTGAGWSPPIAMYQAYPLAGAAGDRPPGPKDFALAGVDGKRMTMQLGSPEELAVGAETAGTILPLPKIWRRTMDALARECAAENRNHICL
jgi:hypothetical protein